MPNGQKTKQQISDLDLVNKIIDQQCLSGLAQIAAYLGCGITKVRYLIAFAGLPAAHGPNNSKYIISKHNIERWCVQQHFRHTIEGPSPTNIYLAQASKQKQIYLSSEERLKVIEISRSKDTLKGCLK